MIDQWQNKADTARLCRLLGASRSGVYAARRRRKAPRAPTTPLQAAFQARGGNYGSRRLSVALKSQCVFAGPHRVRRLMKQQGLKARWKHTFVHTTGSRHDLPVAANLLDRRFNPSAPDQAGATDITCIRTERGWLHLAVVLDLYSQGRRLGDGAEHARRIGLYRLADGHRPAPAQARPDHAYRPWQPTPAKPIADL